MIIGTPTTQQSITKTQSKSWQLDTLDVDLWLSGGRNHKTRFALRETENGKEICWIDWGFVSASAPWLYHDDHLDAERIPYVLLNHIQAVYGLIDDIAASASE